MKSVILGGASRSGKSSVAKALQSQLRFNWYPIDPLINAFEIAFPEVGITHNRSSDQEMAAKFSPFIQPLLDELHHSCMRKGYGVESNPCGYLIDTCYISPSDAQKLQRSANVVVAFFGYPNATIESKFESIRANENKDDWTCSWSDPQLKDHLSRWIRDSQWYERECARLGLPFFDTSSDFARTVEMALEYVRGQAKNGN